MKNLDDSLREIIKYCKELLEAEKLDDASFRLELADDKDVQQKISITSPIPVGRLDEGLHFAIDIRSIVSFPKIDATLAKAHSLYGSDRQATAFLFSLAQLVPDEHSLYKTIIPFYKNVQMSAQLSLLEWNIQKYLWPLVNKTSKLEIFDEDNVSLPFVNPLRWWLYRAAKAVTYDDANRAFMLIQQANAAATALPIRNPEISPTGRAIEKILDRGELNTRNYVLKTLAVLPNLIN